MSIEQQQLDALDALNGHTGHASDLARQVEDIGFKVREDDETGDALIVLTGAWHPDGSDIIAGRIAWEGDADHKARIVCGN